MWDISQMNAKKTLKYLLLVYILSLLLIIFYIQNEYFNNKTDRHKKKSDFETYYDGYLEFQNATKVKYVYRNVTSIMYKNETVEKNVYVEKDDIPLYGENGGDVIHISYNKEITNITEIEQLKKLIGFNTLSDTINLHRKIPDTRHPDCLKIKYPDVMPPVSVVIIFRDEWHSILLRTAYSVLRMSPPHLLKEIVLVDDGSTNHDLIAKVDLHVANVEKLKLVRNEKSLGLMMARQKGIDATTSDYFIVMDGHMEVGPGWLEPLIYRLVQVPNALLCSNVGETQSENVQYYFAKNQYNTFDLYFPFFDFMTLDQTWVTYSSEFRSVRNKSIEPIPYGTIHGGFVAMRKSFFNQLGGYDPGMKISGTEQIELSVKVWRCGGKVEMIPCSKVAHRQRRTPSTRSQFVEFQNVNKARTVEVWFDPPYKDYVYPVLKESNYSMGDIRDRLRIRDENNCKPYQYFLDIVRQFSNVYIPVAPLQKGPVINLLYRVCLHIEQGDKIDKLILHRCDGAYNQYFLLTEFNEIRFARGGVLKFVKSPKTNTRNIEIENSPSITRKSNSKWKFKNGHIVHEYTGLCIEATSWTRVEMRSCSNNIVGSQNWAWG